MALPRVPPPWLRQAGRSSRVSTIESVIVAHGTVVVLQEWELETFIRPTSRRRWQSQLLCCPFRIRSTVSYNATIHAICILNIILSGTSRLQSVISDPEILRELKDYLITTSGGCPKVNLDGFMLGGFTRYVPGKGNSRNTSGKSFI